MPALAFLVGKPLIPKGWPTRAGRHAGPPLCNEERKGTSGEGGAWEKKDWVTMIFYCSVTCHKFSNLTPHYHLTVL